MALTCPNCGDEIPESEWGVEESVDDGITDELVAYHFDPTDSVAVRETAYYCNPDCFVEDHD